MESVFNNSDRRVGADSHLESAPTPMPSAPTQMPPPTLVAGPSPPKVREIKMPLSSFIKEHTKLIKLLDSSDKRKFKKEAKAQQRELDKYKQVNIRQEQ